VDCFAAGVVLAELFTGYPLLYACAHTQERLACLERLNGPFAPRFAEAVESVRPGTFLKNSSPPKLNFTCLPLPIEHNFSKEEREAINRVGSVPSLFVGPTNLSWCNNADKRDYI
jgi:hypothetical protein